jgi:reverse gyrase
MAKQVPAKSMEWSQAGSRSSQHQPRQSVADLIIIIATGHDPGIMYCLYRRLLGFAVGKRVAIYGGRMM